MTTHIIKVPDLGEGIAEVELVAWHVRPGDSVVQDQALADVMTDKATVEIPSSVTGRVLALGGVVGQALAVGAELIRIEVAGADNPEVAPPPVRREAPAPAVAPLVMPATGATPSAHPPDERPIASPAVRRRAWELGIALEDVAPTGTAGRIVQADLDAHLAGGGVRRVVASTAGAAEKRPAAPAGEEVVPLIGLRRRIAQKMQESKRHIPHFTYVEEVDVTELEALRGQLNAQWSGQRDHLTLLSFLVRAMVMAVRAHPGLNAHFDDEAGRITRHAAVHIGIATQTDAGLMVPVLRRAEALDLWSAAREIARLAGAARAGQVTRAELTGSTITLTSLGALGGVASTPIINHPEVAIIGVNRIVARPVIRDGIVVSRQMMNLSSSFDHRVIDGQLAAEFVQVLRKSLESPATLFIA